MIFTAQYLKTLQWFYRRKMIEQDTILLVLYQMVVQADATAAA